MSRIATIIAKELESGSWTNLGVADGADLQKLVEAYKGLTGIIKRGKGEVKLSEARLLSSNTAGGELKAKRIFKW